MKYSVLLLYPDYVAENYGQDTFYDLVEAGTPAEAVATARMNALKCADRDGAWINDPEDFFLLLLIEGHRMALSDGCGRLITKTGEK